MDVNKKAFRGYFCLFIFYFIFIFWGEGHFFDFSCSSNFSASFKNSRLEIMKARGAEKGEG